MTDIDPLMNFITRASDDAVKRDLELTCCTCGTVVCDVEDGDTLSVLADVADSHWRENHQEETS